MSTVRYDKGLAYFVNHWQEGRTLKDVAAEFCVDPGNLDRIFRQRYGMTVGAYVNKRRQEHVVSTFEG